MYASLLLLACSLCGVGASSSSSSSYLSKLSPNSLELFNLSMGWLDTFYDKDFGYLYGVLSDGAIALIVDCDALADETSHRGRAATELPPVARAA